MIDGWPFRCLPATGSSCQASWYHHTYILSSYRMYVCYVCMYEWFGQSRGEERGKPHRKDKIPCFFYSVAYLHGYRFWRLLNDLSDCSDLESNFFLSFWWRVWFLPRYTTCHSSVHGSVPNQQPEESWRVELVLLFPYYRTRLTYSLQTGSFPLLLHFGSNFVFQQLLGRS